MISDLVAQYLSGTLPRRAFLQQVGAAGLSIAGAEALAMAADRGEPAKGNTADVRSAGAQTFQGTGAELMVEQLRAAEVKYLFTNPGSLEVGFFEALAKQDAVESVVALHEGVVIAMADGFHKVSQRPAFVSVHAQGGTAQSAGQLVNSARDGSALLVTAGLADTAVESDHVMLAPPPGTHQSDVTRPFTKSSWDVDQGSALPLVLRRALKTSMVAPGGPTYLTYTRNALEAPNQSALIWPREKFMVHAHPRPAEDQVEALAVMLLKAQRPVMFVGDEVHRHNATDAAVELAELLSIPVATSLAASRGSLDTWGLLIGPVIGSLVFSSFPTGHPLYVHRYKAADPYPNGSADMLLLLGIRDFGSSRPPETPLVSPPTKVATVGLDAGAMGRTVPVDLPIVADVRETLQDLIAAVKSRMPAKQAAAIKKARHKVITANVQQRAADRAKELAQVSSQPVIHPDRLGFEVERLSDKNSIIVSEQLSRARVYSTGTRKLDRLWVSSTGGTLGWGVGAAMGAKLAAPDRQVILIIGDGSLMYSAAGFWSMARYSIPVLTVVWNNQSYETVRVYFADPRWEMSKSSRYPGMYLGDPEIDFVGLAKSQGVDGALVKEPGELVGALRRGMEIVQGGKPYLLNVRVSRVGGGADSTWWQPLSAFNKPAGKHKG